MLDDHASGMARGAHEAADEAAAAYRRGGGAAPSREVVLGAHEILQRLGGTLADERSRVSDLFFALDANQDGMLSHLEFEGGLRRMGLCVRPEERESAPRPR